MPFSARVERIRRSIAGPGRYGAALRELAHLDDGPGHDGGPLEGTELC